MITYIDDSLSIDLDKISIVNKIDTGRDEIEYVCYLEAYDRFCHLTQSQYKTIMEKIEEKQPDKNPNKTQDKSLEEHHAQYKEDNLEYLKKMAQLCPEQEGKKQINERHPGVENYKNIYNKCWGSGGPCNYCLQASSDYCSIHRRIIG